MGKYKIIILKDSLVKVVELEGVPIKIRGFEKFTFFLHETQLGEGWSISEKVSGCCVESGATKGLVIKLAIKALRRAGEEKLKTAVRDAIRMKMKNINKKI